LKGKFLNGAFANIQRQAFLDDKTKIEENIYDEFSDLRDM
jgi:hypothetical protein